MISEFLREGKVAFPCMIARAEISRSNKNAPYLTLSLQDSSGTLDARYWNLSEEEAKKWKEGMVVMAEGELKRYRNAWQMRVFSLTPHDGNPVDFVASAPVPRDQIEQEIMAIVEAMDNPVLKELCTRVLEQYHEEFFTYPAAVRNHHNYPGGLAWHSLSIARLAKAVLEEQGWLDYDLLMAGILLHDLAKIREYSAPVLPEYTPAGNLLGHITMGVELIDRAAMELNIQDSEEVMMVKHMVLSHHGKHEYGSPVLPSIPEAEVLAALDNLDARLFMINGLLEQTAPGTFGPRHFALDNRMFYRKTWDDENGKRVERPVKTDTETETESETEAEAKPEATENIEPEPKNEASSNTGSATTEAASEKGESVDQEKHAEDASHKKEEAEPAADPKPEAVTASSEPAALTEEPKTDPDQPKQEERKTEESASSAADSVRSNRMDRGHRSGNDHRRDGRGRPEGQRRPSNPRRNSSRRDSRSNDEEKSHRSKDGERTWTF